MDAPVDCEEDPLPFFVKMGIKPPYKQWFNNDAVKNKSGKAAMPDKAEVNF